VSGRVTFRFQLDGATRSPASHCDKHLYDALARLGLRGQEGRDSYPRSARSR
jgi:hypothetical protein